MPATAAAEAGSTTAKAAWSGPTGAATAMEMRTLTINRHWVLRQRPRGDVAEGDLELVTTPLRAIQDGEVLIRTIYLSLDPTNRTWMNEQEGYLPPVQIGETMRGLIIGVVEETRSPRFEVGELVSPTVGAWSEYVIAEGDFVRAVPRFDDLPLTANMSVLGMTGLTAYFGVTDVAKPMPGETMVVSAAAGAVGSIAGQIGKILGARVIGIAGGPEKCRWLTEELGFDGAIDYKNEDVGAALDRLCPDGVDVNFENVGGSLMNAVFDRMSIFGRMAICGLISAYNATRMPPPLPNFGRVITHRLTVQGFLILDYAGRWREAYEEMTPWVRDGRIKWKTEVIDGLENAVEGLGRLFTGAHDGKLIVRVSPEP